MITHTPTTANYTLSLHDALPITDVGDDEREALGGERRERLGHRARAGDVVALLGEQLGGGLAHRRVVVDHERAAQPACGGFGGPPGEHRGLRGGEGETDGRAAPCLRLDEDRAAVRPHNAVDGAETEPGAARAGGEEGVERPLLLLCGHASAGVANRDADLTAA